MKRPSRSKKRYKKDDDRPYFKRGEQVEVTQDFIENIGDPDFPPYGWIVKKSRPLMSDPGYEYLIMRDPEFAADDGYDKSYWVYDNEIRRGRFNEGFMSNIGKDGQRLYSIVYSADGWDGSVQEYGKSEEDAIQTAIAKGKLDGDEDIVKVVDLGEKGEYLESSRKLAKEAGRKVIPAANGCSIHDMGDCWIVTNKNGLNIGQCRTLIEAEDIAENANEYTAKKLGYAESKKIVKEGAGAAYTVTIKDAKLGDVRVEKNGEGDWEFEADIVPGVYQIEASDYYNMFCPIDYDLGGEEWAEVKGKVKGVCWWYDEDYEVGRQIRGVKQDISFMYGHGWVHANLPEDGHIVSDHMESDGHDTWEIQSIELNAPQLAECVNYCHEHFLDEDEPEEVDESGDSKPIYMSDDDIAGQYKDWWFSEFGPVEVDGDRLDAVAWIEFPSADGEDFDTGRGLWFVKDMDEDDYPRELNDVWMEPDTAREVKDVARLLMNAKVKYLSFNSAEEFHKYMDEFKGVYRSRFN